jgi:hypothetical protein
VTAVVSYEEFLARRAQLTDAGGFEPVGLPDHLFDFQRFLVEWAVRQGRGGVFADCGLGKTLVALAWADQIHRHTGKPVLILTPLAVGPQFVAEAARFGYDAAVSRDGSVAAAITVTNYEQLGKFHHDTFGGVVCDESSILKSFDGATKAAVTEFMRLVPYRLLATATAAPNDYTELGTSSEALGGLGYMDMLTRFFINKDQKVSSRGGRVMRWEMSDRIGLDRGNEWRLKGHAEVPFWRWVASWARAMRKPSDFGFSDDGYRLPALVEQVRVVQPRMSRPDTLFDLPAIGLAEEREETRRTLTERCEAAAAALEHGDGPAVAWCHLNDESKLLTKLIPDAVEVTGSDSDDAKEAKLVAFSRGEIPVLVTKPKIASFGLNWQHAHRMTYFPSHSYEQLYQATRRMLRFGQTHDVRVDFITTPGGARVLDNLRRKSTQADRMFSSLVAHMNDALRIDTSRPEVEMEVPAWAS